jgi:IPT/TIG domain
MPLALLVAAGCSANDDIPAPAIASITPQHAIPGAQVVIAGSYFCQQPEPADPLACAEMGVVLFGSQPSTAAQYEDSMISVDVPTLMPGDTTVFVSVGGKMSNGADFTVD